MRTSRIIRKTTQVVIFEDNYIPTSVSYIIDETTGQRFKVSSCLHVNDGLAPAVFVDDDTHTELYPARNIIRSNCQIVAQGLNSGADHINIQHLFTYE